MNCFSPWSVSFLSSISTHSGYESGGRVTLTFCMYFRHTALASGDSVAVNIITCLSKGV